MYMLTLMIKAKNMPMVKNLSENYRKSGKNKELEFHN